jgi:hypothetical protein
MDAASAAEGHESDMKISDLNDDEVRVIETLRAQKAVEQAAASKRETAEELVVRLHGMSTSQISAMPAAERGKALADLVGLLTNQA